MLGYYVDQNSLNGRAGQTALELRNAFGRVESVSAFLANKPIVSGVDPLVESFGYTADEAYALRHFFESMNQIRLDNAALFNIGRKMTGLE